MVIDFMTSSKFFSRIKSGLFAILFLTMNVNTDVLASSKKLEIRVGSSIMPAVSYVADNFGIKLDSIYGQPGDIDNFIDRMRDLSEFSDVQSVEISFFYKNSQHISYIKYIFEELIIPRWVANGKYFSVQFFNEGKQNFTKKQIKRSSRKYKK